MRHRFWMAVAVSSKRCWRLLDTAAIRTHQLERRAIDEAAKL